jgi:hypothetical protein
VSALLAPVGRQRWLAGTLWGDTDKLECSAAQLTT